MFLVCTPARSVLIRSRMLVVSDWDGVVGHCIVWVYVAMGCVARV
jgi:hypothetical protein